MIEQQQRLSRMCLENQNEVKEICHYLSLHFGIDHFCYIKNYADGSHFCLNTHAEWMEVVYKEYLHYDVFWKKIDSYVSGVTLWSAINNQESFVNFKQHSKVDNGIVIIDKKDDYCEFFNFGSTSNPQITNFYLSNLDILWRHIFYFKNKAENLIKQVEKDKIVIPRSIVVPPDMLSEPKKSLKEVLAEAPIKKYYLSIKGKEKYLTAAEAKCCYFLLRNKSMKEISNEIGSAVRTVETHIANVKQKLECTSISDLISILNETNFSRINIF